MKKNIRKRAQLQNGDKVVFRSGAPGVYRVCHIGPDGRDGPIMATIEDKEGNISVVQPRKIKACE